jgi:hypothetical protein
MADVTNLSGKRFATAIDAREIRPRDALIETLRRIDAGELIAEHVIISVGMPEGGYDFVQAGTFDSNSIIGLLVRVQVCHMEKTR